MALVKFDSETFGLLSMQAFAPGFNSLGMEDVGETELGMFLNFIMGDLIGDELNEENLLLVKADESGILDKIYGPSVFQGEDGGLVVRVGQNNFRLHQEKSDFGQFKIGQLYGSIGFAESPIQIKLKEQGDREVDFWKTWINFYDPESPDADMLEFQVGVRWDVEKEVQPARCRTRLGKGESIAEWLRPVPNGSGGGRQALKIQDWAQGKEMPLRAKVESIRTIEGSRGQSYILSLDCGIDVWSRGLVDKQIQAGYKLRAGIPCYLIVSKIEQKGDKYFINCSLREEADTATPVKAVPVKEVAAVGASQSPTDDETAYDDIPF